MSVNATTDVSAASSVYTGYQAKTTDTAAQAATASKETESKTAEVGATYEKGDTSSAKATYSANKMSDTDRANLISSLKAASESHQNQLMEIANKLLSGQAGAYGKANSGTDDVWTFLRKGQFTVDAATKAQAQEDISENGYYGVKQTSQRLFDFAKALAGDDPDKLKEMQSAIEKGYKQAEKTWGGELPEISKQTLDATNKLFDEYYKTAGTTGAEA